MKKLYLLLVLLLFAGWSYSGMLNAIVESIDGNYLTLDNGSTWEVYAEDMYRARKWAKGDMVKLIKSEGFYRFEWLCLNRTKEDAIHVHCIDDGRG